MSEECPTPRQFAVERLRKASVWSENTLLECAEDEEFVLYLQRSQFELLKNPYVLYDGAPQRSV